jgi:glycolate oxidase FAD binding subunit
VRGDADIAEAVREAVSARESLRIAGRGTWLDGGAPVRAIRTISLMHDTGVVEYTPGDLTITVRAGTTLREVDDVLLEHNQWLPLDPMGGRDVTVGGTVATCSYGPMAELFGTPRDQVLGLTVVTGIAEILRPGGRVVKNVAGFDLTRLMIGSWGTLGIVTQVTLRVRGRQKTLGANEHMRRTMPSLYGCREPVVTHAALSIAIKQLFDPHHLLNPGIMGEATK